MLQDDGNNLKSVIVIKGLIKKKSLFSTTYEPNLQTDSKNKLIDGIIYRTKDVQENKSLLNAEVEKFNVLKDMDF